MPSLPDHRNGRWDHAPDPRDELPESELEPTPDGEPWRWWEAIHGERETEKPPPGEGWGLWVGSVGE